jgi:histidinol-phosphate aminotransferase
VTNTVAYLNKNELPWPPPPAVVHAAAAATVHEYPPFTPDALTARLARFLDVEPEQLAVGEGSAKVLLQILQGFCAPGNEVVFAAPGFEAYPALIRLAGARPVPVPLRDHRHNLDAILDRARLDTVRVVILCNPHNPTGTLLDATTLMDFLAQTPPTVLVVMDEAYREFAPDHRTVSAQNVAVLRTFSKAYGLAGLRVGYCLAAPRIALTVRRHAVPYSVTQAAQNAAIAALDASQDLATMWTTVIGERDRVRAALLDAGFAVPRSHANFLWLDLGTDAERFRTHCANQEVIVHSYPDHGVRVSTGCEKHNEAFLAAARSFANR